MSDDACMKIREALDGATGAPLPAEAEAHVAACVECARTLARQRTLVRLLEAWPPAPAVDLDAPKAPASPGGRIFSAAVPRWAAAAAALLVAAVAWRLVDRDAERVRVDRVVDVAGSPPLADERLLALTGGFEAVAMRRPTEVR
jgi:hypothetical protein